MTRLFKAKPFIIAEVGSNWTTKAEALHSITSAKASGADAVKFQAFSHEALYGWDDRRIDRLGSVEKQQLSLTWLPELAAHAKEHGIEFMCTAFSPELVAAVDPYVGVHKVASSDLNYPQLLQAVARTGKPVLFSTGAATDAEVMAAVDILGDEALGLSCTAAYPADFTEIAEYDGLSDHTLGYTASVEAARLGAMVIEKHFTAFPALDTPDRPHSLTPQQFRRMVDIIRGRPVESEEQAMHLRHKRRLIATEYVQAGEPLRYGVNFGAYRSKVDDAHGLSPLRWEEANGRTATVNIKQGSSIGEGDFE